MIYIAFPPCSLDALGRDGSSIIGIDGNPSGPEEVLGLWRDCFWTDGFYRPGFAGHGGAHTASWASTARRRTQSGIRAGSAALRQRSCPQQSDFQPDRFCPVRLFPFGVSGIN